MKGNQHFTMTGFHPDAGVAGNVLVGGDGAGEGAVGGEDGPAGEVFFLVFVEVVIGLDGGAGEFLGIPERRPVRRTRAREEPRCVKDSK